MELRKKYQIYIGTVRGVLTVTDLEVGVKCQHSLVGPSSEISVLEWGRTAEEILIGYKNSHVVLYNCQRKKSIETIKNLKSKTAVIGISSNKSTTIVGQFDGTINLRNGRHSDCFLLNLEKNSTLECMGFSALNNSIVSTGGELNEFKLWNLENKNCTFKAKSLGHDELNLQIPTSIRGICSFADNDCVWSCATREGHILFYDIRAQRKPIIKYFERKASFTSLSSAYRERQCLAGTTKGYIQLLDMKVGKCLRTFSNMAGSVTSICCDSDQPIVMATNLDRYLRIYNFDTKELIHKEYMKQGLTRILMKPYVKIEKDEINHQEAVDEEYDSLFNSLETVVDDTTTKYKRKTDSLHTCSKKLKRHKHS